MDVRRCAIVVVQPTEQIRFEFEGLLRGGDGLVRTLAWEALAPHLDGPVVLDAAAQALLGSLSPSAWTTLEAGEACSPAMDLLIASGLVLTRGQDDDVAARDERLRATHWHPLAAVMHAFSRWEDVDAVRNMRESQIETASQMRRTLGPPPPHAAAADAGLVPLPPQQSNDFDALLARRVSCRNFDVTRSLPLSLLSQMLQRAFGSSSCQREGDDLVFLKKNVPSGGGLHPVEAYVLVRNVDGLAAGMYLYRAQGHGLMPVDCPVAIDRDFVMSMVGQQHWFADAHVLVVLAPRFNRTYWKYRQHGKSYRVVAMEAGHLSQTLYLAATDAGLGAFITAAINEKPIERALGLDTINEGVLAVCGFGWRASRMTTSELDPAGVIWNLEDRAG
ncbi:putative peptide maturation dehydrogenase [Stenotrophomonas sp. PS02299]|uniref:putative peptide maturation dehydrogenase n=1 Tax=Stenotrophomonas TaxID=40323 RepID=UPI00249BADBB|nr:putative peptide maturation dehydrogenase [Stenotrophomonas sp. PS02299]